MTIRNTNTSSRGADCSGYRPGISSKDVLPLALSEIFTFKRSRLLRPCCDRYVRQWVLAVPEVAVDAYPTKSRAVKNAVVYLVVIGRPVIPELSLPLVKVGVETPVFLRVFKQVRASSCSF